MRRRASRIVPHSWVKMVLIGVGHGMLPGLYMRLLFVGVEHLWHLRRELGRHKMGFMRSWHPKRFLVADLEQDLVD